MIRSLCSTLGKAIVLCALALTLAGDTSAAFDSQESGGPEQQRRRHQNGRHQNELTFTQIDFPGATNTVTVGINDPGQIVGFFIDSGAATHSYLLDNGAFTQIDVPGATETNALGINDCGQIVGSFGPVGAEHGFLLDKGVFTQIDFPGSTRTLAFGINKRGQIVGSFADVGGIAHGFLLDDGVFTQIDVPSAPQTLAFGINDRGKIVGEVLDAGGVLINGFLLDDGVFTRIDFPGAARTAATGINDRGQIVGEFAVAGGNVARSFLLDDGVFIPIDAPDAIATTASGINNRAQIVGRFADAAGVFHGFLARKEQFNGNAIGAGAGEENAAVEVVGTFTSLTDLDLSAATLNITNMLNELAGGGELVRGLPLTLTAVPGSHRNFALFVDRSRPNLVSVTILDAGAGKFIFKIKVNAATINSPQNCSPTRLTTSFRLDAESKPSIIVSTERQWFCFGPLNKFLKTH